MSIFFDYLTDDMGQLNDNYTTDGLHLSPQGYQVLAEPIIKGDFRMKVGLVLEGGGCVAYIRLVY